jgi:hypothetical protein
VRFCRRLLLLAGATFLWCYFLPALPLCRYCHHLGACTDCGSAADPGHARHRPGKFAESKTSSLRGWVGGAGCSAVVVSEDGLLVAAADGGGNILIYRRYFEWMVNPELDDLTPHQHRTRHLRKHQELKEKDKGVRHAPMLARKRGAIDKRGLSTSTLPTGSVLPLHTSSGDPRMDFSPSSSCAGSHATGVRGVSVDSRSFGAYLTEHLEEEEARALDKALEWKPRYQLVATLGHAHRVRCMTWAWGDGFPVLAAGGGGSLFTCVTGTKVQILTR